MPKQVLNFQEWLDENKSKYPRELVRSRYDRYTINGHDQKLEKALREIERTFNSQDDEGFQTLGDIEEYFDSLKNIAIINTNILLEDAVSKGFSDLMLSIDYDDNDNSATAILSFYRLETDGEYEWRLEDGPYASYASKEDLKNRQIENLSREKDRLEQMLSSRADLEKSIKDLEEKIKDIENGI